LAAVFLGVGLLSSSVVYDVYLVSDNDARVRVGVVGGCDLRGSWLKRLARLVPLADLSVRFRCDRGRSHVVMVLLGELILRKWVELACTYMLNRVEARTSFLKRRWVGCILLHSCEGALVDTFDELRIDLHIWVFVQDLIACEQILFVVLLLQRGLLHTNDFLWGEVYWVVHRLRVQGVAVVCRLIKSSDRVAPR